MVIKEILKDLSSRYGVSGNEENLTKHIKTLVSNECDLVEIDNFNNLICYMNKNEKNSKRVMLTAHIDEIGFMIKSIDDQGFIMFTNIGGIDPKVLLAQEVEIHGKKIINGVIGAAPPHLIDYSERLKGINIKDLYIDTGFTKETLDTIVSIGDVITFKSNYGELKNNMVYSKSLDNRVGAVVLLGVIKELKRYKIFYDVVINFTSLEETTLAGVTNSVYNINPDCAIVVDVCHGKNQGKSGDDTFYLGDGPAIAVGPNLHPKYSEKLTSIAKKENINYQIDVEPGNTGTEAWATQVSRNGIPTSLISVPIKYMHTPVECVNIDDIELTIKLIVNFISKLHEMENDLCY